jgi:hypothetical protein
METSKAALYFKRWDGWMKDIGESFEYMQE